MAPERRRIAKDSSIVAIEDVVKKFKEDQPLIQTMMDQLLTSVNGAGDLMSLVHSVRWRVKDPDHLKDKLVRKLDKCREDGSEFDVNVENYRERINDLAGLRLLHLHTSQIVGIDRELKEVFSEFGYTVIEPAKARTWDDEYRAYYESVGIATTSTKDKMYTSVHYVISPQQRSKLTCEVQVRTLAEELWGEVDHAMNYPKKCSSLVCSEQIKVLARITSGCSRLVDSIYVSRDKLLPGKRRSGVQKDGARST